MWHPSASAVDKGICASAYLVLLVGSVRCGLLADTAESSIVFTLRRQYNSIVPWAHISQTSNRHLDRFSRFALPTHFGPRRIVQRYSPGCVSVHPKRHCVRWVPSSPSPKKATEPPIFGPCLLCPNGWMDEDPTWYGGRPRPKRYCVRWGPSSPPQKGQSPPHFSAHV